MVSEAFKQNVKKYGREIDAKFVFDGVVFSGEDIIKAERIFDANFMTTTMQEVNGELNGRYNLKDKSFSFLFGVKPKLETTNQIDKNFSGLRLVGNDLVQTMVVEPGKIYNLRMEVLNTSHKPMTVVGIDLPANEQSFVEDTIVIPAGQTTWDLVISGESLHFVVHDPHFELDNRFIEYEYIDLGRFNVVDHERIVNAEGDDKTTFKAFDHMIRTHDSYNFDELEISFPISIGDFVTAIAARNNLVPHLAGVNLTKTINNDEWTREEGVSYRNVLDDIAQMTGAGITVFNNELNMVEFNKLPQEEINEDDLFSLNLKSEFGPVNIVNLTNTDTKVTYRYPANWETIVKDDRNEIVLEDNQIIQKSDVPTLFTEVSKSKYYPFEADTQGFTYLRPLETVNVIDMDRVSHRSVIMHSTLKIDNDVKESFKALTPVLFKSEKKIIKPEDRKLNRVQSKVNELVSPQPARLMAEPDLIARINALEDRIHALERGE